MIFFKFGVGLMKLYVLISFAVITGLAVADYRPEQSEEKKSQERIDQERMSYALGYEWGASVFEIKNDLLMSELMRGLNQALGGKKSDMTIKERKAALNQGVKKIRENRNKLTKEISDKFIKDNSKNENVSLVVPGVFLSVIKPGKGKELNIGDRVKINYKVNSLMGVYLDDTFQNNKPVSIKIGKDMPDLSKAMTKMSVGGYYKVFLSRESWSKDKTKSNGLSPNDVLIYEVEVLNELFDFDGIYKKSGI